MSLGLQGEPTQGLGSNPPASQATVEQALAHCDKLEEHALQFKGKDGHNPFLWLENSGVNEFRRVVAKAKAEGTEVGQSLIDATLAIQPETPAVQV